ncbi:3-methyl-2-oxobutanoate hydroxymethyltransferase [Acetobacteraceae bacterium ESL0709]|nr:3-methyl-2-oxobutanoate hydroxymethyltransferase [Acetobacteraceae bacterium ESL0697]MDF7677168.1 3-methyl-2-oxobutanoate hydroxymethyltransferase [Acetobacteraceae bacterium ESL0709]
MRRVTIADIQKMKNEHRPITMVTVYDYSSALIAEKAGIPTLLVGDSLAMVMHGHDTTVPLKVEEILLHAQMVKRGSQQALILVDMPFMSYATEQDAVNTARLLMQEGGCQALKLEGGAEVVPVIRRLTEMGVPVMAHLGLTPQSQHQIGLRVQGRDEQAARKLIRDALAVEKAGAFAILLEVIPAELAALVSRLVSIPTIGIGAGVGCDGQVQVWHDVLGLFDGKSPRHAKRFAEIGAQMTEALEHYKADVETRSFPTGAQSASMEAAVIESLENEFG